MRNRKFMTGFVVLLVACSALFSNAARKDEVTLIMVPREDENVLRLAKDIAERYPTLLIRYQLGANNAVALHGWTGTEWVNVKLEAFHSGDFFRRGPDSALVVEKTGVAVPGKMLPPPGWCANAAKITTTEMRPLLHLIGQYYDFSFKEWEWFAKRYSMDIDAINPERLNISWYHKRMSENLKPRNEQGASDLQYWVSIRQPAVVPVVPPSKTEEIPPAKTEEAPPPEDMPDTMLTNDAPEAVVMGAADAEEEHSAAADKTEESAVETKVPEEAGAPPPAEKPAAGEKASESGEEME